MASAGRAAQRALRRMAVAVFPLCALAACSGDSVAVDVDPTNVITVDTGTVAADTGDDPAPATPPVPPANSITVDTGTVVADVDPLLLGSNQPIWLSPEMIADPRFHELATALGTTILRLPGGSWSNDYDWLACETADPGGCPESWNARPSDMLRLLSTTGMQGMWAVAFNGTAEEAAAVVAFFNGAVDDARPLGVDRLGRDWKTVGDWARLRAERGFADPQPITYWEVGNEVFGAVESAGPGCAPWGWEQVWTCDPLEYALGDDEHDGYVRFREAMKAVDPAIQVGAVGVGARGEWNDWDDALIGAAGAEIDFLAVHHYGSDGNISPEDAVRVPRSAWPRITADVRAAFADHGIDPAPPLAITEYNVVNFVNGDTQALMATATAAFYLADTIGQFAANGVAIANQWVLLHPWYDNVSNYALIDADTMLPTPAYFAMALWARAGDQLVEVGLGPADSLGRLSVYGLRDGAGNPRLLVLNPTDTAVAAEIAVGEPAFDQVLADVVQADSLTDTEVSFNGSPAPSADLSAPPQVLAPAGDQLSFEFAPFSITLLRWAPATG